MEENSKKYIIQAIVVMLVIAVAVFVAIDQTLPPDALPTSAATTEFSAERAIAHIQAIAQEPRLVGDPGFAAARDYVVGELTRLELSPEIQKTRVTIPLDLRVSLGGDIPPQMDVENILARIAGSGSQDAILLVAHLDSRGGPGASDDANGVAVLLETARALLASPPLRNTVILLFTAPEESGTHGAVAFIREHPWITDVSLVINFDAGGLSGPSELTNTSPNNGWLIRQLAVADRYAFGSSSSGTGDSDFNSFKYYGFSGYAFDYSRDQRRHTPFDNVENLNPASIQHQGYHALSLTHHFGNLDTLDDPKDPNPIYFNILRLGLVSYPDAWAIPIMLLVTLVFVAVLSIGFRRKYLTFSGIVLGMLLFLISLIAAPAVVRLLWAVLSSMVPRYQVTYSGHAVNQPLLLVIFASITIALTTLWYVLIQRVRKVSIADLTIGALALLFVAVAALSITSPESSYGITWSLFFCLLAVGYWFYSMNVERGSFSTVQIFVLLAAAVVAIVLLVPDIFMTFTGSETNNGFISMILLVALLGLLIPQLHIVTRPQRWWLPIAAGLLTVASLAVALLG